MSLVCVFASECKIIECSFNEVNSAGKMSAIYNYVEGRNLAKRLLFNNLFRISWFEEIGAENQWYFKIEIKIPISTYFFHGIMYNNAEMGMT